MNKPKVYKHGVILSPTRNQFEKKCVFNPGVLQDGKKVHVVYRALDQDYISTLGYARLNGPLKVEEKWKEPLYVPKYKYESGGVEDPCLVKIKDTIYMTYVAHDGVDAVIAYMHGEDITKLKRGGIISAKISYKNVAKLFPYSRLKDDYYMFAAFYEKYNEKNILVWEKDGVLFPEKIRGKYAMLHRVLPDVQLARFEDFWQLKDKNYWTKHIMSIGKKVVLEGNYGWEARHVGAGAAPIKTKKGWIMIYHGVEPRNKGRIYHAGAALLDLRDPTKVIGRLREPLFSPEKSYETEGHVNNVVFPTGTATFDNRIYIYYGTSDTYTAVASVNQNDLLKALLKNKVKKKI